MIIQSDQSGTLPVKGGKTNRAYRIKFKPVRDKGILLWSRVGYKGPLSWENTVKMISEKGIEEVKQIQHFDKTPANYRQLDGKEMLLLWKAVKMVESSNLEAVGESNCDFSRVKPSCVSADAVHDTKR